MYKKVRMLYSLTLVIMLTACNAKGNDSANDLYAAEIQTVESVEIPAELPTATPSNIQGENGEVILESDGGDSYSGPGDYDQQNGAYASDIDSIIHANRLVIPLLVTENDKVEKIEIRRDERNINLDHFYLK